MGDNHMPRTSTTVSTETSTVSTEATGRNHRGPDTMTVRVQPVHDQPPVPAVVVGDRPVVTPLATASHTAVSSLAA
ncbi:hypothetical protein [Streptomyces clavuligerus]|uniref:Uncharacterized protein n=1 Tax=Streptomyces clavuligerus TaxID=1901 RepID=B5GUN3_STRCL|nr:hypothetical protein [Streptomyces clavuligerus]EDY50029.1 hypothetical protein SSCG_03283 [Streptomyces clavuligerus]EFG03737.1 Hypothetical protein SCLAV_p0246 [Streptomyces clavuligerus]MBY6307723.1 hypothetical protein [Streptomyces clavuligerus]QCS09727.1 hypothetical protein CRV15_29340 [Streptomyces clavuligerus]QPJ98227.1 hypothetical protein GE265_35050 [Streptomyces clavuligerus]